MRGIAMAIIGATWIWAILTVSLHKENPPAKYEVIGGALWLITTLFVVANGW